MRLIEDMAQVSDPGVARRQQHLLGTVGKTRKNLVYPPWRLDRNCVEQVKSGIESLRQENAGSYCVICGVLFVDAYHDACDSLVLFHGSVLLKCQMPIDGQCIIMVLSFGVASGLESATRVAHRAVRKLRQRRLAASDSAEASSAMSDDRQFGRGGTQ
jgi:hypothetical protein